MAQSYKSERISVTACHPSLWWNANVLCIPMMLYMLGVIGGLLASAKKLPIRAAWRVARVASMASLLFAVVSGSIAAQQAASLVRSPKIGSLAQFGAWHVSFRFDLVDSLMLLLVSFLSWVIVSYSRTYMAGDPREPSYVAYLMLTLASVSLLIVTNNLILFLAAWVLTEFSLHGLLTLYPHRQAAVITAHKKFLASRLGDLTLLCAVILLGVRTGSVEIDEIARQLSSTHTSSASIHVAAILLAISAIIKCAQLPLHGWLIQVMEAPTPVSALLHAGVVNLGGFMLIRLAPVINTTLEAEWLLVVVGCLTATIASLVMTTRISIKVNLAWSTCAQMGFMLVECGLGLYSLALLHLLAHSLYKAHAFLGSGETVNRAKLKRMMPSTPSTGLQTLLISGASGLLLAALAALLWRDPGTRGALSLFCVPVVGLAVAALVSGAVSMHDRTSTVLLLAASLGICVVYFSLDHLFHQLLPAQPFSQAQQRPLLVFCFLCFLLLNVIQMIVRIKPAGAFASAIYPWLYAGLYLDELFTRATFRLWPAARVPEVAPLRDATQPFDVSGVSA